MIVTGMFVADFVRVAEGKLDALGGVQDWVRTDTIGTDRQLTLTIVVLVQRQADDDAEQGWIEVEILSPDGETAGTAQLQHQFHEGSENGFVYMTVAMQTPVAGRYNFVATSSGSAHSAAIGFRVLTSGGV